MTYLLDSQLVAELRKGPRCDQNVARWFEQVADNDVHLSVLTLGELCRLADIARRSDLRLAASMKAWIDALQAGFKGRLLPVDAAVAREWGALSARIRVAMIDGLLAATAKAHGLTLASRNVAYLAGSGAQLFNPYLISSSDSED